MKNTVPFRVTRNNAFTRDPEGGTSRQHPDLRKGSADRMRKIGIPEAICLAFERTGLLVTKENFASLPQAQQDEWDSAIEEAQKELGGDT